MLLGDPSQNPFSTVSVKSGRQGMSASRPVYPDSGHAAHRLGCRLRADFVAEVGCCEPRSVIHRTGGGAAAGADDDGAAQPRSGAAVLFVLPR